MFFSSQTVKALKEALLSFETLRFRSDAGKANAAQFSADRFRQEFLSLIETVV
jgi:hypothetical protein